MNSKLSKLLLTAAVFGASTSAAPAYALDHVLSFGVSQDLMLQVGDAILVDAGANRSYACEGDPLDIDTDLDFSEMVEGTSMDSPETVTGRLGGAIVPGIGGETDGREDNRVIFTPTKTDRYKITVSSTSSGGENVRVRCFATTLFGGFNTNVNDFNFLELTNIGNADITAKITAVTFDGTTALDNFSVTIPAGQRKDISLHDTAGSDVFGNVRVTHDAPFGTLLGTVSQYYGAVSDFRLGGAQPLVPFTQNQ